MEEIDQNLIERYLANDLSEKERADFERRRRDDALFNQEITDYENAKEALVVKQREELRSKIRGWDKELDSPKPDVIKPKKFRHFWLAIAAILLLGLLLWWFMFTPDHPSVPVYTDGKDTLRTDKPNVVDSISPRKEKTLDQRQNAQRPEMAEAAKKGADLFAANFDAYKDESLNPSQRGQNSDPLDQFRRSYWDGQYTEAIKTFSNLSSEYQNNDNLRFVYAVALAATDNTEVAQLELQSIMQRKHSIYLKEANWYMALLYLKEGDMENTRKYLQVNADHPGGFKYRESKKLLDKIK